MEKQIKELKELSIAHKCALEFDYCPESDKADHIINNLFDYNKSDLI